MNAHAPVGLGEHEVTVLRPLDTRIAATPPEVVVRNDDADEYGACTVVFACKASYGDR